MLLLNFWSSCFYFWGVEVLVLLVCAHMSSSSVFPSHILYFWDRVLIHSPGWHWTSSVCWIGLELKGILLSQPARGWECRQAAPHTARHFLNNVSLWGQHYCELTVMRGATMWSSHPCRKAFEKWIIALLLRKLNAETNHFSDLPISPPKVRIWKWMWTGDCNRSKSRSLVMEAGTQFITILHAP